MSHPKSGYLKLILGPMFSGKSTKLIELIRKYKVIKYSILTINNSMDTRYSDTSQIVSHNKDSEPCVSVKYLNEVHKNDFFKSKYMNSQVIFIEEAQFFSDLNEFVTEALKDKKTIYVVGLNGDSNQNNFGEIHKLLPKCNDIELLKACCKICMDETPAEFSKRITQQIDQVHVGGVDEYIPVCRYHFELSVDIDRSVDIDLTTERVHSYDTSYINEIPNVVFNDNQRVKLNLHYGSGTIYNPDVIDLVDGDLATVKYNLGGNNGREYWILLDRGGVLKIDWSFLEKI